MGTLYIIRLNFALWVLGHKGNRKFSVLGNFFGICRYLRNKRYFFTSTLSPIKVVSFFHTVILNNVKIISFLNYETGSSL